MKWHIDQMGVGVGQMGWADTRQLTQVVSCLSLWRQWKTACGCMPGGKVLFQFVHPCRTIRRRSTSFRYMIACAIGMCYSYPVVYV